MGKQAPPARQKALTQAAQARHRLLTAQARKLELDTARRSGMLVDAKAVGRTIGDATAAIQAAVGALPSRFQQRWPDLTHEGVMVLTTLCADILEELAQHFDRFGLPDQATVQDALAGSS